MTLLYFIKFIKKCISSCNFQIVMKYPNRNQNFLVIDTKLNKETFKNKNNNESPKYTTPNYYSRNIQFFVFLLLQFGNLLKNVKLKILISLKILRNHNK